MRLALGILALLLMVALLVAAPLVARRARAWPDCISQVVIVKGPAGRPVDARAPRRATHGDLLRPPERATRGPRNRGSAAEAPRELAHRKRGHRSVDPGCQPPRRSSHSSCSPSSPRASAHLTQPSPWSGAARGVD